MENKLRKLLIDQLDRKFSSLKNLNDLNAPAKGWVYSIRTALKMSLRQLGSKLGISAQSVKEIEQREADGSITLKSLREAADALEMKVVYAIIPKDDSIENMIEKRANKIAREIVLQTSNTMMLEDQENSNERIEKAIKEKAEEIKIKMPKYLWD